MIFFFFFLSLYHLRVCQSAQCNQSQSNEAGLTCWLVDVVPGRVFPPAALQTGAETHSVGHKATGVKPIQGHPCLTVKTSDEAMTGFKVFLSFNNIF